MAEFRKILVLCLAGAGDTLMTTPLFKELRTAYPEAQIDVLVAQGKSARDVVAANPNVNAVVLHDFLRKPWWASILFCLRLRRQRYDCSILPMPHNRLAYNFIAFLAGAPLRIGFKYAIRCGSMETVLQTRLIGENTRLHLVDNNQRIITEALGKPLAQPEHRLELALAREDRAWADEFLSQRKWADHTLIGFHPGSGTTKNLILKRWAPEKWSALARIVGARPGVRILVFGGSEEQELCRQIVAQAGPAGEAMTLVSAPSVKSVAALVAKLAALVCGDTLFAHLGAATGTPVVDILGPTSPVAARPYGVPHRIVRTGIYCSPCYGYSRHGIRCTNAVHLCCLKEITPEMVAEALKRLCPAIT